MTIFFVFLAYLVGVVLLGLLGKAAWFSYGLGGGFLTILTGLYIGFGIISITNIIENKKNRGITNEKSFNYL